MSHQTWQVGKEVFVFFNQERSSDFQKKNHESPVREKDTWKTECF